MVSLSVRRWIRICIINFLAVAVLGILMRYKISFPLPGVNQKYLLHAHSHFAFSGWITQMLYVLMIHFLQTKKNGALNSKYQFTLIGNLIAAYGMLFSFAVQGYGAVSITFSTASIFIHYFFCFLYVKDLKKIEAHPSKSWFKAALIFGALSSVGVFYLAYMMISKSANQDQYLGSIYFYLHFQYNGWFTFASMGLLIAWLRRQFPEIKISKTIFRLFFWACIPAYFLSMLWANLSAWLYALAVLAAIAQMLAWMIFLKQLKGFGEKLKQKATSIGRFILLLVAIAFSIKLLLQSGSAIPALRDLAFGFRPVVIAYLHLVLLAVFTLFVLGFSYINGYFLKNKITVIGLLIIIIGIFLNELTLSIQGMTAFSYIPIPFVNEMLFGVAVIILLGIIVLLIGQYKKTVLVFQKIKSK